MLIFLQVFKHWLTDTLQLCQRNKFKIYLISAENSVKMSANISYARWFSLMIVSLIIILMIFNINIGEFCFGNNGYQLHICWLSFFWQKTIMAWGFHNKLPNFLNYCSSIPTENKTVYLCFFSLNKKAPKNGWDLADFVFFLTSILHPFTPFFQCVENIWKKNCACRDTNRGPPAHESNTLPLSFGDIIN